jgi:hypothetical protein
MGYSMVVENYGTEYALIGYLKREFAIENSVFTLIISFHQRKTRIRKKVKGKWMSIKYPMDLSLC